MDLRKIDNFQMNISERDRFTFSKPIIFIIIFFQTNAFRF